MKFSDRLFGNETAQKFCLFKIEVYSKLSKLNKPSFNWQPIQLLISNTKIEVGKVFSFLLLYMLNMKILLVRFAPDLDEGKSETCFIFSAECNFFFRNCAFNGRNVSCQFHLLMKSFYKIWTHHYPIYCFRKCKWFFCHLFDEQFLDFL